MKCPRCRHDDGTHIAGLCLSCENELDLEDNDLDGGDDSEYTRRLADGFALIDADEDPYDYDDRWS